MKSAVVNETKRIRLLTVWFACHARKLPWRRKRTGYRALVAELMLQQTQVARVVERYQAFLLKFPTMKSLALASEHDLLLQWQGLGYYRRARHLHAAARMVVEKYAGRVPRTVDELQRLPGVGRYTAGAIASIVYGEIAPIVDGNVQRVLARWFARRGATDDRIGLQWTWKKADDLVKQATHPGRFNEALMELGSLICTPRSPKCEECPVRKECRARRLGLQHEIPSPKRRIKPQSVHHHAVMITRNGKMLAEQRGSGGMWAGLWQTPTIENACAMSLVEVKKALPMRVMNLVRCGTFDHQTSHRSIRFHLFHASSGCRSGVWIKHDQMLELPMSNAQRRVISHFNE